jgi:DNA repair photolyase
MSDSYDSPFKVVNQRKYNTWCKYKTRIDTYGCGCQHDCSYCYAKALLKFRNNWDAQHPKMAFITDIEKAISIIPKNETIRLGSMTDCFQPIERKEMVTYETVKLLNRYGLNYLIVTKNSLVADERFISIYDKNLAHFQITITSTDNNICSGYENASPVEERIKAIEKLSALGFDISIRLSPFLFQWVDTKIINRIECKKILIEFLKVNHWIRKSFKIDYSDYTVKYGGHENLTLEKKIALVGQIKGIEQISIGEYVKDHYEYFRDNVNHNKEDCCNLGPLSITNEPEQLKLFNETA